MIPYTNEDLENDKERNKKHKKNGSWISFEPGRFDALLNRLEASDKVIASPRRSLASYRYCYVAYLKSKGETND